MSSTELTTINAARRALEAAETVPELADMSNHAEALRLYAKRAGYGLQAQNQCAALKLEAERKAGGILAEMNLGPTKFSAANDDSDAVSLSELGIERHDSSRWQRLATVPEDEFQTYLANTVAAGKEITQTAALKLVPQTNRAPESSTTPQIVESPAHADLIGWWEDAHAQTRVDLLMKCVLEGLAQCNDRQRDVWIKHTGVNPDGTQGQAWPIPAIAAKYGKTREYFANVWLIADQKVLRCTVSGLLEELRLLNDSMSDSETRAN